MTQQPGTPQKGKAKWIDKALGCLLLISITVLLVMLSVLIVNYLEAFFSAVKALNEFLEKEPKTLYGVVRSYYYNPQKGSYDIQAVVTNTTDRPFVVEEACLTLSDEHGQILDDDSVFYKPQKTLQPGESMTIRFEIFPSYDLRYAKHVIVEVHGWLLPKTKQ